MLQAVLHLHPHVVVGSSGLVAGAFFADVAVSGQGDQVIVIAAIAALPASVVAVGGIVLGILNLRAVNAAKKDAARSAAASEASHSELVKTAEGVFEIGHKVDGMLEKLLAAELIKGVVKGTADERVRQEGLATAHTEGVAEGQRRGQDEHPDPVAPAMPTVVEP